MTTKQQIITQATAIQTIASAAAENLFKRGSIPWNKGRKATKEEIENNRVSHYGQVPWNKDKNGLQIAWNKGKEFLKAENNPAWRGGTNRRYWTRIAKERDNFTCQICGLRDIEIVIIDHIEPVYIRPDLIRSLDNLMTLCPNCHARKTKLDRKSIAIFKRQKI